MKIAIPVWQKQVSNVFDFANRLLLVDVQDGERRQSQELEIAGQNGLQKLAILKQNGVEVLICGAISRPIADMLEGSGIELVPFVTGPAEQVIDAYITGQLNQACYMLPGCARGRCRGRGRARRFRGGRM